MAIRVGISRGSWQICSHNVGLFRRILKNVQHSDHDRYVLDGNAMGMTAAEGFKRRKPVAFGQPDSVVVSIGYPLTNAVYDMVNRFVDYKPPFPDSQKSPGADPFQGSPSAADPFLDFIGNALRPWLHGSVFPNVKFTRDALFGHSFGGLLVTYALVSRPEMFDTYLAASPALEVQNNSILAEVTARLGTGNLASSAYYASTKCNAASSLPALMITYGSVEEFPARRRTENETAFQTRKKYFRPLGMTEHCHDLFDSVKASGKVRDVVLKEYVGQDHAGVAASAITDGIDYFVDW
jgi:hypothetical protein